MPSRPAFALVLTLALPVAVGACGDRGTAPDRDTIDRETFIATYVDLRVAALDRKGREISPADRERILAEHGVTEEDLLTFADVHGGDVHYMKTVWEEVESRLDTIVSTVEPEGP